MGEPLVSILIPTFNRAEMLSQAIDSALRQTYRRVEVIVADNASADDTASVVERASARDPRVRYIRHDENRNYLGNMRYLIETATGDYLKFLMDDDVLLPTCVRALLEPCLAHRDVHFAMARRRPVDENLNAIPDFGSTMAISNRDGIVNGIELGNLLLRLNLNVIGEASSVLFHRGLLEGGGDVFALDDHDFEANLDVSLWLKMLAGSDAFHVAEPQTLFRVHGVGKGSTAYLVPLIGNIEWERLIEVGRRFGYLADSSSEIEALGTFIRNSAQVRPRYVDVDHRRMLDEAVVRAGVRLASLLRPAAPAERTAEQRMSRVLREVSRAEAQAGRLPPVMGEDDEGSAREGDLGDQPVPPGASHRYDISVVIPLHNRVAVTERCLTALADGGDEARFEVVLVDDRSTDATAALLACLEGDITIVDNDSGVGFAALVEKGLSRASGRLLALASPELEVTPGWFDVLLPFFADGDGRGGVGAVELGSGTAGCGVVLRREALFPALDGAFEDPSVAGAVPAILARVARAGWCTARVDIGTEAVPASESAR